MNSAQQRLQTTNPEFFDPTEGSSQFGYREISGDIPGTDSQVSLLAWAIVFREESGSLDSYRHIEQLLNSVGADGLVHLPISGIVGDRFGNMSERTDSIGEYTTIWVSALSGGGEERGAVLASLKGVMVQLIATSPYIATERDRAVYLVEHLAINIEARESDLSLTPENDTMSRLPKLGDVAGLLENASITINRYLAPRHRLN